jgi:hypothetical protein
VLSDGTHTHIFTGPSDTFDIHSWDLSKLTIKPAGDANFTLQVVAIEQDAQGNLSATTTATEQVTVNPSAPTVAPEAASGVENTAIALNLGVMVTGQPGDSNSLATLNLSGATAGTVLSDGIHTHIFTGPGDTFDIHSWNLSTLTIKPAGDANFTLQVAAIEKDAEGNLSATTTATEQITVGPSAPTVSPVAASGVENTAIALNLWVTVTGQSGDSNSLATLNLSGATAGTILSDGIHTHIFTGPGDTFDIHSWDLSKLTIKPAGDANFTLTIAATEQDAQGNLSTTTTATEQVTVNPSAPTLAPVAASGVENTALEPVDADHQAGRRCQLHASGGGDREGCRGQPQHHHHRDRADHGRPERTDGGAGGGERR